MVEMSDEEFEALVADALDELPEDIQNNLHNLVFLIEEEPSEEQLRDSEFDDHFHPYTGQNNPHAGCAEGNGDANSNSDADAEPGDLLGLYEGFAQTDGDFFGLAEPNKIFIFRGPTLRLCDTKEEVAEEVMITVFHEIAHHFGIEEDELWDLGWG